MNLPSMFWRIVFSLLLTVTALGVQSTNRVQAGAPVVEANVQYTFGRQIDFSAQVTADLPVKDAIIFIQSQGETQTSVETAFVAPPGEITYSQDLSARPLRAFANIDYWFKIGFEDGTTFTSDHFTFFYADNRFLWQTLESKPFRVHWYQGDMAFAQGVLDVAKAGQAHIQEILPLPAPVEVNLYIYASMEEMQTTLRLAGQIWVAGHADPDLQIIVAAIPAGPEQHLITEQRVPHELMHIMLYQVMGNSYANLPAWVNEGLASMAELSFNPDYNISLEDAILEDRLIPIQSLCPKFPVDAAGASLSYAESALFTFYLYRTFGTSGLETLVANYANGMGCEQSVQSALGKPLTELQAQWIKDDFSKPVSDSKPPQEIGPWFIMLIIVIGVPFGLMLVSLRKYKKKIVKGAGSK